MNEPASRWSLPAALVTLLICTGTARDASAQFFVSPFVGYNFGGSTGCPQALNCENKHVNYGIGVGALGSLVGFEAEVGHTNDFLGSSPTQSTNVLTFMGNFLLAPKFGPVQAYGVAGIGWMRTNVDSPGQSNDQNQIGWDGGGGLMVFFGEHIGIRGDVRFFQSFQLLDLNKLPNLPIAERRLDFGRVSGALVFKF
jgi:opacity protein-like surface antigen